ncbi:GNAT family N-acetyltransferase [Tumidithrix helvetica PCC 7403]|uniref:GNAT family N-acetyltransferase n=1 Tax=Tumidithrix helvetica TaxID=3457545 RepID=UPI003C9A14C4
MDNRHIRFCDRADQVDLNQLLALFKIGAFWANERNLDSLAVAIANSDPVVTVWDNDRLIGHARATSDVVYRATIWDVVIHPDYRGTGLGRKLVQTVLAHPKVCNVERVYLMTTHQQSFYQHIGFELNASTTLVLCNKVFSDPISDRNSPAEVLLPQSVTVL